MNRKKEKKKRKRSYFFNVLVKPEVMVFKDDPIAKPLAQEQPVGLIVLVSLCQLPKELDGRCYSLI